MMNRPIWLIKTFRKRKYKRHGIRVIEWTNNGRTDRIVAQWGPYTDGKRFGQAARQAQQMIRKLEIAWPCGFLVKNYKYKPQFSEK